MMTWMSDHRQEMLDDDDPDLERDDDGNPYPAVTVDNEEEFLTSFYHMEKRRFQRQMASRVRGSTGDMLSKACVAIVLVTAGVLALLSALDASEEAQLIMGGRECPSIESKLEKSSDEMNCLEKAFMDHQCAESDPVVQYHNASKECFCCTVPAENDAEVGPLNPDANLYRMRRINMQSDKTNLLDSISLVVAILTTLVVLAVMLYMMKKKDNPWTQFFAWTSIIFFIWYVSAPFYNHSRVCFYGLLYGVCASISRFAIAMVWLTLMIVVFIIYLVVTHLRTTFVNNLCDAERGAYWYWHLERVGRGRYTYRPHGPCTKKAEIRYRGATDASGKPHGRGEWTNDSYHGEVLEGMWDHGLPHGKFRSMEYGTGAQFVQRPVGYYSTRGDSVPPDELSKNACGIVKVDEGERPFVGVGMVELSIAGGFYEFLPELRKVNEASTMIEMIHSFNALDAPQFNWKHDPRQHVDKFEEALVFVHGWGTDLELQLEKVSLLLSLGKCWPHIKPIVFGWSCGNVPAYFTIKNHSIDYVDDFIDLFRCLEQHFEVVHVMCHSAGAELFCHCFPYIKQCFVKYDDTLKGRPKKDDGLLDLANVIFVNPDVLVEKFAEVMPEVMEYACRCTSYNDTHDVATAASTWVQRLMPTSCQDGWRDPDLESWTQTWGRVVSPIWLQKGPYGKMELHGPKIDEFMPEDYSSNVSEWCPHHSGGQDDRIDVIDCSYIDYNAGFSRHNYYALNSLMGEDMCECVSQRKSAHQRSHLAKRKGNVFDFLAAPKALSA